MLLVNMTGVFAMRRPPRHAPLRLTGSVASNGGVAPVDTRATKTALRQIGFYPPSREITDRLP